MNVIQIEKNSNEKNKDDENVSLHDGCFWNNIYLSKTKLFY